MGYVHDTNFAQFIPVQAMTFNTGTWAVADSSNVVSMNRTAADSSSTVYIPVLAPSNASALKGAKLIDVDVFYSIATAAADDFATVELEKMTLPATGTAVTGAAVSTTEDTGHDTAAERKATGDHTMTVTLDTAAWIDDGDAYILKLVIDCAAATVLKVYGAVAHFELRA